MESNQLVYCGRCGAAYYKPVNPCKKCGQPTSLLSISQYLPGLGYSGGHPSYPVSAANANFMVTKELVLAVSNDSKRQICFWMPLEEIQEVGIESPDTQLGAALILGVLGGLAGGGFYLNLSCQKDGNDFNVLIRSGMKSHKGYAMANDVCNRLNAAVRTRRADLGLS